MITFEQFICQHNAPGIFKLPARPIVTNLKLDFQEPDAPIIETEQELQDLIYLKTRNLDLTGCAHIIWREYLSYAANYAWHQRAVSSNGK